MSESKEHELGDGAFCLHVPGFLPDAEAQMERLLEELPLRRESISLFGRSVWMPRLVSYHGEPGCWYRYSGRAFAPQPFGVELRAIRDRLRSFDPSPFNAVLVNHYRDGSDSMGAHADDEPELGPRPLDVRVASISLGARRRFRLRPKGGGEGLRFDLGEGDLLIMGGTTQRGWVHEVPKTRRAVGPRMSLTFRCVRPGSVSLEGTQE